MTLAERIKRLRQERGLSQGQFATKLNVHQKQISCYERGLHVPATEALIRMAEALNISLDYLVFEDRENVQRLTISDLELVEKFKEIDQLPKKDKETIKAVLETFIVKNRFQKLAIAEETKTA